MGSKPKAKVLVVEDGPTLTHGEMKFGAGTVAAERFKAGSIVDAERYAVNSLKKVYRKYPLLKKVLPSMGYSKSQIKDLQKTINQAKCDVVIDGTPVNLERLIKINKPIVTVNYELHEVGKLDLIKVLKKFDRR